MKPEFPIRIINDEGDCEVIESPEELMGTVDSIDSTDPAAKIWVRDVYNRTVRIRIRGGIVLELSV
ncbi:MAG TPA: hypothetical protein VF618_21060 [Thermoanaerobaculia bacterium]